MVNISEARLEIVQAGNIRMRIAVQGSGPLVLLCHGFPEFLVLVEEPVVGTGRRGLPGRRARYARLRRH